VGIFHYRLGIGNVPWGDGNIGDELVFHSFRNMSLVTIKLLVFGLRAVSCLGVDGGDNPVGVGFFAFPGPLFRRFGVLVEMAD